MHTNSERANVTIHVAITDGSNQYYLLKVERSGYNVFCCLPRFGAHYTRHESGISHLQPEDKTDRPVDELPVMIIQGEAGRIKGKDAYLKSLYGLGAASCILHIVYLIGSIDHDYRKFNKRTKECFLINTRSLPENTQEILVGVWAVPARNKASFECNNPNIPADLLYKFDKCEPQIWIYARPLCP